MNGAAPKKRKPEKVSISIELWEAYESAFEACKEVDANNLLKCNCHPGPHCTKSCTWSSVTDAIAAVRKAKA